MFTKTNETDTESNEKEYLNEKMGTNQKEYYILMDGKMHLDSEKTVVFQKKKCLIQLFSTLLYGPQDITF